MYKIILLLLLTLPAEARESVMFEYNPYTTHLDNSYDYNSDTHVVGFEYCLGNRWCMNTSIFKNSFYANSMTIGAGYNVYRVQNFNFDALFGLVGGYPAGTLKSLCLGSTCAYISPRVSYSYTINNHLVLKPSVKGFGSALVFSIGLEYVF